MRKSSSLVMTPMALLLGAILSVVGCGSSDSPAPNSCTSLTGMTISATSIGLATKGAKVTSAILVSAADAKAGVEYCKVVGEIYPIIASETIGTPATAVATPNINFQVNLPTTWNNRALQLGGGGFDGSIPSSLDSATASSITSPLARGYATLGSDSGHTTAGMPTALWNSEALRNFGRQQIKKTHDAAMAIIKARYSMYPVYSYFQGGSQGGHEALIAANFYPEDYDGVIVGYPAYNLEALHPGAIDYSQTLYNPRTAGTKGFLNTVVAGGGWISRAQMKAVSEAIIAVCDVLDGATDGLVSNPGAAVCKTYRDSLYLRTAANPLRCAGGAHTAALGTAEYDAETCLADPQIETLARITSRYNMPTGLTLEGGLVSFGKWPVLDGMVLDLTKDPGQEDFGSAYNVIDAFQSTFPSTDQVNIITRDSSWTRATVMSTFDVSQWVDRVMTLSSWIDTSSVDYSAFRGKGGKMIHYHGAADVSITPYNSIDLYMRMTGQFNAASGYLGANAFWGTNDAVTNATASQNSNVAISGGIVEDFYSFYLIPGMGHGKGFFRPAVDWLTALENWVEQGYAPRNSLIATDTSTAHASLGTRPVCYFPYYPKYTGAVGGDIKLSSNYTCTKLDAYTNVR